MKVRPFRYNRDNLGYVVHGSAEAVVVDGGAAGPITDYLNTHGLTPVLLTNTHAHGDHTQGNDTLKATLTNVPLLTAEQARDRKEIPLEGETLRVIPTPGHTLDSVCFHGPGLLLSGDTLFIGKVGRCFSGRPDLLHRSVQRLLELPGDTLLYPGHDYVEEYLLWCKTLEPDNPLLDASLAAYHPDRVVSTLDAERRINPFLHPDAPGVTRALAARGLPCATPEERWNSLLSVM